MLARMDWIRCGVGYVTDRLRQTFKISSLPNLSFFGECVQALSTSPSLSAERKLGSPQLRQLHVPSFNGKRQRLLEDSQKVNTEQNFLAALGQEDKAFLRLGLQTNTRPCDWHWLQWSHRKMSDPSFQWA